MPIPFARHIPFIELLGAELLPGSFTVWPTRRESSWLALLKPLSFISWLFMAKKFSPCASQIVMKVSPALTT